MNQQTSPMLERLQEFLNTNPKDSFVRYGLAMELAKLDRISEAIENFHKLIQEDPDYVPAYLQAGLVLVRAGRKDEAKEIFRKGIDLARRKGDNHAYSEIQGALADTDYH